MTGSTSKPSSFFHEKVLLKSGARNCRQSLGIPESKHYFQQLVFYRIEKDLKFVILGAMGSELFHGIPCRYKGIPL